MDLILFHSILRLNNFKTYKYLISFSYNGKSNINKLFF